MKLICKREDFLEGMRVAQNALTSITLPILTHVLMVAKEERVSLTATNLETTIRSSFPGQVQEEGEICLPGDKILDILRELPPLQVNLDAADTKATIRCEKATFHLLGLSSDEFPEIPSLEAKQTFSLPSENLREMIQRTVFAASRDETRQNLNGVYLEVGEKELKMVATDGRRLAFMRIPLALSEQIRAEVIIPLPALQQLVRILGQEKEVKIGISQRQIFFQMEPVLLISQLVEAKFPNYRDVIPTEYNIAILTDRDELYSAVRRVSLLADEKSRLVKFKLQGNILYISANAPEMGGAREEVAVRPEEKGDIEIGFNSTYLLDVFKNLGEGEIRLELTDPVSPGLIRPSEGKDYITVVMPVRLEAEEV
ncbi:MAG: DNA polymerase III subunit beta [bacterium]